MSNDLVPGSKSAREILGSRLGFILLSAGCAIGLGNVWRFPFITGEYGGAIFVLIYILCLCAILPILVMEFSVGRASRLNMGLALKKLEPAGTCWSSFGWLALVGSYLLMMFYTTVTGWMLSYCYFMFTGDLASLDSTEIQVFFQHSLANPTVQITGMSIAVLFGFIVCALGVRKGVERTVTFLMLALLLILFLLVIRVLFLPGALEGIRFYLMPDWSRLPKAGFFTICNAAMTQAFFTLSIGIGSMCIFGSYQRKDRSLTGEAIWIASLDTFVGIMAGLIIFPACFAFGVSPDSGPGLVFVTLPNIFNGMPSGNIWGGLFFIFMAFASLTTVVAVFENIISYSVDVWGMRRIHSILLHLFTMWLLSLPCALGFSRLSFIQPLGNGSTILDFEDFLVNNNILPFGGILFLLFCCLKSGWGWNNFIKEADEGMGLKFPAFLRPFLVWILPVLILLLFIAGYIDKFFK